MNRYGTFWQRFGAGIIDGLVLALVGFLVSLFFDYEANGSLLFEKVISDICFICYSVLLHGRFGQTLGKMAFDIKVVFHNNESKSIGYNEALKRDLVRIVLTVITYVFPIKNMVLIDSIALIWFLAEIITLLFNPQRRAIHDFIAGSVVIDIHKYSKWEKVFYAEQKK